MSRRVILRLIVPIVMIALMFLSTTGCPAP